MRRAHLWIGRDEWKAKQETGETPGQPFGLQKVFTDTQAKSMSDSERLIRFVISNASADRDKDTLAVNGWILDSFRKNPVVPFAHDYRALPVARALDVSVERKALVSTAQFVQKDIYPFADTVFQMIKGGFLNAVSVGFRPLKHRTNKESGGIEFLEQELLEYSVVPVPANPEALVVARSSGIDTTPLKEWAEQVLDETVGESMLVVPKSTIEQVVKLLGGTSVSVDTEVKSEETAEETPVEVPVVEEPTEEEVLKELSTVLEEEEQAEQAVAQDEEYLKEFEEAFEDPEQPAAEEKQVQPVVKLNPTVLDQPLPQSYEWTRDILKAAATDFLTSNGIEVRQGFDFIVPISTFVDKMVFAIVGRDRSFAEDPIYQGSYSRDRRISLIPRFTGEPQLVDIQVSAELIELAGGKGLKDTNDHKKAGTVVPKEVEIVLDDPDEIDGDVLKSAFQEIDFVPLVKNHVRESVRETVSQAIKSMRGQID